VSQPDWRDGIEPGDTLRWAHKNRLGWCWGLVEYTTADGVHVKGTATQANYRYTIGWNRVFRHNHFKGRAEYDRHNTP